MGLSRWLLTSPNGIENINDVMNTTQTLINQLIKTLAEQLRAVDNATLGLKSTYKKIAQCSKTVAQLEKLGVDINTSFDRADLINGVADRDTIGLA